MESLETFKQLLAEMDIFHGRPTNSSKIIVSTMMLAPAILLMKGVFRKARSTPRKGLKIWAWIKLTTEKSKDLKISGTRKSYRTNEKPRDDLPRAMEGLHLDTSKQRGKGNTNPLNSRRIEFVAASSSSSSPGSTRNNNNNIKHGDCVAMSHGKGRTSRENNNKREDMPKKASGTSSSPKKEARSKIITRGTLARADKSSQTSSRSTPPSTPRIVQEVHFDRKNIRKIGRELRRKMTDALLRANMEANTSRKSS